MYTRQTLLQGLLSPLHTAPFYRMPLYGAMVSGDWVCKSRGWRQSDCTIRGWYICALQTKVWAAARRRAQRHVYL